MKNGIRWVLDGNGDFGFEDSFHLYNFMNYLYRTDASQKWTNDQTPECESLILGADTASYSPFGFPRQRQKLHDEALASMREALGVTNLGAGRVLRKLFAFYIAAVGEDERPVRNPVTEFPVPKLATAFDLSEEASLLLMVSHVDQEARSHIHGVYAWHGRKPQRHSRFLTVLSRSEYGSSLPIDVLQENEL